MPLPTVLPQETRSLLSIEHGWHNDLLNFVQRGLPKFASALLLALLAQRLVLFFTRRLRKRADSLTDNGRRSAQLRTVAGIFRASAYGLIGFYVFLQFLGAVGVPLGPFIASAGVIGLGISFGAQSIFKDVLNGIFILVEDQFSIGDSVKLAGLGGTVEDLTLRCTKLRDGDGTLYIVPNSQITTVSNLSRDYSVASLSLAVSSSEDPDRVISLLQGVARDLYADGTFAKVLLANPDVPGVDRITGREVSYPINVRVRANQKDGVLRELRRRVLLTFAKEGVELATSSSVLIQDRAIQDRDETHPAVPAGHPLLPS